MSNLNEPDRQNSLDCTPEIYSLQQDLVKVRLIQDRSSESQLLIQLGSIYFSHNQTKQAFESYNQSIAIAREIGERRLEALALLSLGWVYQTIEVNRGNYKQMRSLLLLNWVFPCCKNAMSWSLRLMMLMTLDPNT